MSGPELHLAPAAARTVLDHALETAPDECCGILVGPELGRATQARRAKNVHTNPRTRYEIDPDDLLAAIQHAEAEGLKLVGFYHSHPRGHAAFSDEDRDKATWEGADHLLISLSPLTFLAGRWDGERFVDVTVRIPPEHTG